MSEIDPKKKKDQLSLAQWRGNCDRPDPDGPGGLGAEESGTERTGPTQDLFLASREGGRLAEVGRYYDSANVPVTAVFRPGTADCSSIRPPGPLAAVRRWRDH